MRESVIEQYLRRRVESLGGRACKWVRPGEINAPDRILLFPGGRIAFVEVKAPGEKPRPGQLRELQKLRDMGFPATWLDSKEAVDEFLANLETDGWLAYRTGTAAFSTSPNS